MSNDISDTSDEDPQQMVLLDASCVLNLFATGRIEDILRAFPARFGVVAKVREESLFVLRGGGGADAEERDPVDLAPLIQSGLLIELDLAPDEQPTFVAFAARLDDGEAATCAVAVHRGMAVTIDERKGRNVLASSAPVVVAYRTLDFVRHWAEGETIPPAEVERTLRAIRERGRFMPGRGDPHKTWWETILPLSAREE